MEWTTHTPVRWRYIAGSWGRAAALARVPQFKGTTHDLAPPLSSDTDDERVASGHVATVRRQDGDGSELSGHVATTRTHDDGAAAESDEHTGQRQLGRQLSYGTLVGWSPEE